VFIRIGTEEDKLINEENAKKEHFEIPIENRIEKVAPNVLQACISCISSKQ